MSLIPSGFAKNASAGGFYDHPIEQSLRFDDGSSAYLSRTPSSAGNAKKWTFSAWVKLGDLSATSFNIIGAGTVSTPGGDEIRLAWQSPGQFRLNGDNTSGLSLVPNALHRDPSAWYHVVVYWDTAHATASERAKLYINGEQVTSFSSETYPSQNKEYAINQAKQHKIGQRPRDTSEHFDGYLAEVHFIDGQALDASSFGETKSGVWIPKAYAGSYGTNGFYLPFNHDYSVEGFSATTYTGNGGTQYIGGVGFEPDLVWVKERGGADGHGLFDSVRGATKWLGSESTAAEGTYPTMLTSFDPDGFSLGSWSGFNESGMSMVAWCWDAGSGSPVSNTDGSITSSVKASTDYGFSIVSYTGTGSAATVGHGLSQAPEMMIVKSRGNAFNWIVYSEEIGASRVLTLDATDAQSSVNTVFWNDTAPTSSVFSLGSYAGVNYSSSNFIAYCFHSVSGYSKFGSYTGTGSSGNSVTTGFKPAFVMVKRTDNTGAWYMLDSTRNPTNTADKFLRANTSGAESTLDAVDFTSTGFDLQTTAVGFNASGGTYIYMAFADKREAAFWLDQSGNNNDFENNNLTESDISLDSPTNNFATLNPLDPYSDTLSEGNLKVVTAANNGGGTAAQNMSTIAIPSSGKWYCEDLMVATGQHGFVGVATGRGQLDDWYGYYGNVGYRYPADTAYGATFTTGDIIGIAVDVDSSTITFYKNNVSQGALSLDTSSGDWRFWFSDGDNSASVTQVVNFGQDSSFAGNKTAQGNTDANGYGDFYYAPPTGYLALCTANLTVPDAMNPALDNSPQDYFNTVLYTGNGTSQSITGVGLQPSWTWIKRRDSAAYHHIYDAIRGGTKVLYSNATDSEQTSAGGLTSFDSDGFSIGNHASVNTSGGTYAAWNWKANGSGVSNTDGSITSTVSANTDAGFSIVSYTGNGSAGSTIGHGLTSAPDMIITKNRDTVRNWGVYHSANTSAPETDYLLLNSTAATADSTLPWNDTAPTSSVFTVGTSVLCNTSGDNYIAYCFHSVEGFSKAFSYTGNGNSDGVFVYCGFKPAWLLYKRTDTTGSWVMYDAERDVYNPVDHYFTADTSDAESGASTIDIDFTSNGYKIRTTSTSTNASGGTYIGIAFAESPFKYSTAR